MTLENIIERIEEDAQIEAKKIVDQAREGAKSIVDDEKKLAKSRQDIRIEQAKEKAHLKLMAAIAQAKLEARNILLVTKREMIEKAYELSLEKINNLNNEDYEEALIGLIARNSNDGDMVIIGEGQEIADKANQLFQSKCSSASLVIDSRQINKRGFILKDRQGSMTDFTFDNLINYNKDVLELDVFRMLVDEE